MSGEDIKNHAPKTTTFRCALLAYLQDPSSGNKSTLYNACINLAPVISTEEVYADRSGRPLTPDGHPISAKVMQGNGHASLPITETIVDYSTTVTVASTRAACDIDATFVALTPLLKSALEAIKISETTHQQLDRLVDEFKEKDGKEGKTMAPSFVMQAVFAALPLAEEKRFLGDENDDVPEKQHFVTEAQEKVLKSIYAIELDGHRLNQDPLHKVVAAATLTLSKKLFDLTHQVIAGTLPKGQYLQQCEKAWDHAKPSGIGDHRGIKQKFYNFLNVASCCIILGIPYQIYKYCTTGNFWSTAKTQTHEDVETFIDNARQYPVLNNT